MRMVQGVTLAALALGIGMVLGTALDRASAQESTQQAIAYRQAISSGDCADQRCNLAYGACNMPQTGTYCATSYGPDGPQCETKSCGTAVYAVSVAEVMLLK